MFLWRFKKIISWTIFLDAWGVFNLTSNSIFLQQKRKFSKRISNYEWKKSYLNKTTTKILMFFLHWCLCAMWLKNTNTKRRKKKRANLNSINGNHSINSTKTININYNTCSSFSWFSRKKNFNVKKLNI